MVEYPYIPYSGFHRCDGNGITVFPDQQYWLRISCLLQPIALKAPVCVVPALYKKPELQRILHGIPVDLSVCHYAGYPQVTTVDSLDRDTAGLLVKVGPPFQAERRLRPLALRLRITSRPSRVDILVKKP